MQTKTLFSQHYLETRLPQHGVDVLIIPEAGHAMMEDNPDGFAEIVGEWLERIR